MARGRFYERFEIPAGASGVGTVVHIHHDGEHRREWRALLERARRPGLRGKVRDVDPQIPERLSHEEIQRDARRRVYGSRREEDDVFFHNDSSGWHERPYARDRHADALRQFRDALKRFYRDQELGETEAPLVEFWAWVRAHMDPSDWGAPRADPNRTNTASVHQYAWPAARPRPLGFKTSGGQGNSSGTMTPGSAGFRDSVPPQTLADLNQLHRRHYRGRVL